MRTSSCSDLFLFGMSKPGRRASSSADGASSVAKPLPLTASISNGDEVCRSIGIPSHVPPVRSCRYTLRLVMRRTIIACTLVLSMGAACGTASIRSPERPRQVPARTADHSAALAEALADADSAGQAEDITRACDFGYPTGKLDGIDMGFRLANGTVTNHCLGAITPKMIDSFVAEVGPDSRKITEKCRILCEGKPVPAPESKYGESLLLVTQNCAGDCFHPVRGARFEKTRC